jgi:hypothetical protein
MLATGIKSGIENRDINWSRGFTHFSRHWLNAGVLALAFGSSCLGKMYVVERQEIKKESHSNPVVKNFECGPLAGFVAVVERNELNFTVQNVTIWWLALHSRVREVPASNFVVPFDDRRLEHLIHLYFMLLLLGPKVMIVV